MTDVDRIEWLEAQLTASRNYSARLRAALSPTESMTLMPDPSGGHSITLYFPGGYEAAAPCYELLMQAID